MQPKKILNSKSIPLLLTLVSILLLSLASAAYAAVALASFEGVWDESNNKITLTWETGSENDHSAFKVWRSTENLTITDDQIETGDAQDITEELADQAVILSPSGGCNATGNHYEYTDETIDEDETDYYYYLESLDCRAGSDSTFYGALNDEPNGLKILNPAEESEPTATKTPTATPSGFILHLPIIMQHSASR
jgi:hypothetical protein